MTTSEGLEFTRIDKALIEAAWDLLDLCQQKGLTVVTAESCTGGLVAAALTDAPGASKVVDGGFVTYSNEAKQTCLGVSKELLDRYGAVSEQVARAMAEGALKCSPADLAVSVTGIAGPSGGSEDKPVGLVHFAAARRNGPVIHRERRFKDEGRGPIRRNAAMEAIGLLSEIANLS